MEKKAYEGKVKHQGPQKVEGPYAQKGAKGNKTVVKTGSDLRAKKG